MTPQKTSSPRSGVFAQDDWSIQNTRARSLGFYCCLGLSVMGIAVAVFAALFAPAMWVIVAGGTAASIAFLLTARQLIAKYYVVEENLKTIFHVSTARWDPSTIVTLSAEHCAYWRRIILQRPRAVYFFRARPTLKHLKQQDLAGAKDAVRFLYEMEPRPSIALFFQRGSASMVHHDVPVRVLSRQVIPCE